MSYKYKSITTFNNINCTGTLKASNQISAQGGILMGGALTFSGGGSTSINAGIATLPQTTFNGTVTMGGNDISGAGTVYCTDLRIGSQTLQAYILQSLLK